jgi:putative acyl-CoA dehydrogenase
MPGRQRIRRGGDARAPLPRGAAQRDLGGLGQRDLPRRAARARARARCALPALLDEIRLARGADARLDAALGRLEADFADPADAEVRARDIVERLAIALQASLLLRDAPPAVADAFCASRLGGSGRMFGTLPARTDFTAILERALPA